MVDDGNLLHAPDGAVGRAVFVYSAQYLVWRWQGEGDREPTVWQREHGVYIVPVLLAVTQQMCVAKLEPKAESQRSNG